MKTKDDNAKVALDESRLRLQAIFDNAWDAILLADDEAAFVDANPAACELLGYSRDELLNSKVWDIVAAPHEETLKLWRTFIADGQISGEWALLRRDGTLREVEFRAVANMLPGIHLSFLRDITARKQAEEELGESEMRYSQLFAASPDALFVLDSTGRFLDCNETAAQRYGYSRAELLQMSPQDLAAPDLREQAATRVKEALATGGAFEWRHRRKDDSEFSVEISAKPFDMGGQTLVLSSVRDITERKHAEAILFCQTRVLEMIATGAALTETLDTMLRLIEKFATGMLTSVLLLDADGRRVRHAAAPSLPEAFNRAVDGEPIGPSSGSCGTAAFRREPVIVEDIATDPLWADYRELALAHGLRACWSTPIFDEQQQVLGTFAIYYREPGLPTALHRRCIELATHLAAVAISRHHAVTALQRQHLLLSAVVEGTSDAIFAKDLAGRYQIINSAGAQALGKAVAEVIGRTDEELLPSEVAQRFRQTDEEVIASGQRVLQEEQAVLPGGTRYFLANKTPWRDPAGALIGIIGISRDITVSKQAEVALRESEEHLRKVMDGLGPYMFVGLMTPDGVLIEANTPALTAAGLRPEDVLGQPFEETYWWAYSGTVQQQLRAAVALAVAGTPSRYDVQIRAAEGVLIWIDFTLQPLRDESGQIVFLVPSAMVITERKQGEEALRESHNRLKKVLEVETVGVMFWDLESGCMTDANTTFLDVMGYSRSEVEARELTWQMLTPPEYMEASRAELRKFQESGRVGPYEKEYLRKDGTRQWFVFAGSAVDDNTCVEFCVDISDRKQAEIALRESEARLRLSVAASNIGLWDWNLITNEVFFSPEWKAQLGYAEDEFPNRFDEWESRVHPDDLAPTLAKLQRFIENPTADYAVEFRLRHKDGSWRWIYTRAQILRDQADRPLRMLGCHVDITARKQAEEALRESERNLTEAQRIAHVGSWSWNLSGLVQWTHELYRVYGVSPETFSPTVESFFELVYPEDRQAMQEWMRACGAGGKPTDFEFRAVRPDGTVRFVSGRGELVRDAGGRPMHMVGTAQDITERKQAEASLEASARQLQALSRQLVEVQEIERRTLARELHDEIGQILTGLKLMLEMSARRAPDTARLGDALSLVNELMAQVRELSLKLRPAMLDDLGLLPALLWHFERYQAQTGVQVDFKHSGLERRFGLQIETAAYRIVQEALTNVARHAGASEIQVRLRAVSHTLALEIEDRGAGFDAEAMPPTTSSGLIGMRERALLLEGNLTLQTAPGQGTRILVELPLADSLERRGRAR